MHKFTPPIQTILSVCKDSGHHFSKQVVPEIELIAGHGVAGDAHAGKTVKHRSRVAKDPSQPNLRQVHLIANELFEELADHGFALQSGQLGENMLTSGIDLINLPRGTIFQIGRQAQIEVTGLRNPCAQIENFRKHLLTHMIDKREDGSLNLKTGIMAIVRKSGTVRPGDAIRIHFPPKPFERLERV